MAPSQFAKSFPSNQSLRVGGFHGKRDGFSHVRSFSAIDASTRRKVAVTAADSSGLGVAGTRSVLSRPFVSSKAPAWGFVRIKTRQHDPQEFTTGGTRFWQGDSFCPGAGLGVLRVLLHG